MASSTQPIRPGSKNPTETPKIHLEGKNTNKIEANGRLNWKKDNNNNNEHNFQEKQSQGGKKKIN